MKSLFDFFRKFFRKKIIIITGAILLAGLTAGWVVFFSPWKMVNLANVGGDRNLAQEKKKTAEELQGFLYQMEPFIVNLADSGPRRYLKVRIAIESSEPKVNGEYEKKLPELRDNILMILSSKVYNEIIDSEGKEKLREEIKGRVNQILQDFKVKSVFFTEFLMQ